MAKAIAAEFPRKDDSVWNYHKHYNCWKLATNRVEGFPQNIKRAIDDLSAPPFIHWLSDLVGIPGLLADPLLEGGGLHQIEPGGYLKIHADFIRHHRDSSLLRKVNLILFLNDAWDQNWGGELELWNKSMEVCVAKYPPLFNHAVIFSTSETTWHGHPHPLNCPPGERRKSIALYYYTKDNIANPRFRSTRFKPTPNSSFLERVLLTMDNIAVDVYSKAKNKFRFSGDSVISKIFKLFFK